MSKLLRRLRSGRPFVTVLGFVSSRAGTRPPNSDPSAGYICPVTGEVLPCPNCCPLNNG